MDLGVTVSKAAAQAYPPGQVFPAGQVSCGDAPLRSFAMLYDTHASVVFALARRITRDRDLAEEAVHNAFLQVWRGTARHGPDLTDLTDGADLSPRLRDLVQGCALEAVRRRDLGRQGQARPAGPGCLVRGALERLPWAQRQPVVLAHFFGHTEAEIAALTGLPLAAVTSRIFAGMALLNGPLSAAADDRDGHNDHDDDQ